SACDPARDLRWLHRRGRRPHRTGLPIPGRGPSPAARRCAARLPSDAGNPAARYHLGRGREPRRRPALQPAGSAHRPRDVSALARSVQVPRPLAEFAELIAVIARRPTGLLGLIGVGTFLLLAYVAPLVVPL